MDESFATASTSETKTELLPIALAVIGSLQGQTVAKSLVVLLDSGSKTTWINKKSMPKGIHGYTIPAVTSTTLAGTFTSSEQVCVEDLVLPEYNPKASLAKTKAQVFHAECRYDMILGRDVLRAFGIKIDFEQDLMFLTEFPSLCAPFLMRFQMKD